MSIWTGAFWKATAERAVSTAAQSAILVFGADQFDAMQADWRTVGGFALGGAVLSVLKSLAVQQVTGSGPSLTDAERLVGPTSKSLPGEPTGPQGGVWGGG